MQVETTNDLPILNLDNIKPNFFTESGTYKDGRKKYTLNTEGKDFARNEFEKLYFEFNGDLPAIRDELKKSYQHITSKYDTSTDTHQMYRRISQSLYARLQYTATYEYARYSQNDDLMDFSELLKLRHKIRTEYPDYEQFLLKVQELRIDAELQATTKKIEELVEEVNDNFSTSFNLRRLFIRFRKSIIPKVKELVIIGATAFVIATSLSGSISENNYIQKPQVATIKSTPNNIDNKLQKQEQNQQPMEQKQKQQQREQEQKQIQQPIGQKQKQNQQPIGQKQEQNQQPIEQKQEQKQEQNQQPIEQKQNQQPIEQKQIQQRREQEQKQNQQQREQEQKQIQQPIGQKQEQNQQPTEQLQQTNSIEPGILSLPENYVPPNLVDAEPELKKINNIYLWQGASNFKVAKEALPQLIKFLEELSDRGYKVLITNTYRSYTEQENLHNRRPQNAAPAGHSQHQTGKAFDMYIIGPDGNLVAVNPNIIEIAKKYNIVHPLPKDPPHFFIGNSNLIGIPQEKLNGVINDSIMASLNDNEITTNRLDETQGEPYTNITS